MTSTFIGIDLAWGVDRNHTGIAVLRGDQRGARLASVAEGVVSLASIVEFVEEHSTASTVVAVDAPLVVTNAAGFRECEREIGRRFGRFHASCHSNNLSRTPQPAGVRRWESIEVTGFRGGFLKTRCTVRSEDFWSSGRMDEATEGANRDLANFIAYYGP